MKKSTLLLLVLLFSLPFYGQVYTLGTGTTVGANNTAAGTQLTPYKTWYEDGRGQFLYRAAELTAAGASASGGYITGIAFSIASANTLVMNSFNIKIKNTTVTALTTTYETGLTTVYSGTYIVPANGWQSVAFTTPYHWDGTSSIVVEICYDNSTYSANSTVNNSTIAFNGTHYSYTDGSTGCTMTTNNGVSTSRPNTQFTIITKPVVPNISNSGPICPGFTADLTGTGLAPGGVVANLSGSQPDVSSQVTGATGNNFTMEFWVNPTGTLSVTTEQNGLTTIEGISGQRYAIFPFWGGLAALNKSGAGVSVGTNGVSVFEHADGYMPSLLVYNQTITGWTHIAIVYTNRTPALYINGVLAKQGTLQSQKSTVYPTVGSGGTSSNYGPFTGKIDNVRIWNSALTAAQIQGVMFYQDATIAGATLLAHYTYNGSSVTDLVGTNTAWNTPASFVAADYFTYTWSGGANPPTASTSETQTTGILNTSPQVYTVTATALGGTGAASGLNTVIVVCPLPIELVDFKARCEGSSVRLSWSTATESHNDYFTIEKSTDATNWQTLAHITGSGNSIVRQSYSMTDENNVPETVYYRLSQTDYDGNITTFDIISTNCSVQTSEMKLAPNPATDELNVQVTTNTDYDHCVLKIIDKLGRPVLQQQATLKNGENNIRLHLQLSPGIYSVILSAPGLDSPTQRLIVQ